jgi:hypothetical protein
MNKSFQLAVRLTLHIAHPIPRDIHTCFFALDLAAGGSYSGQGGRARSVVEARAFEAVPAKIEV